jgi:hypothetical protein
VEIQAVADGKTFFVEGYHGFCFRRIVSAHRDRATRCCPI